MAAKLEKGSKEYVGLVAEWEKHERTFVQWPKASWEKEYRSEFVKIIEAIAKYEPVVVIADPKVIKNAQTALTHLSNVEIWEAKCDNCWARDCLGIFETYIDEDTGKKELAITDWVFDGWGKPKEFYSRNDNKIPQFIAKELDIEVEKVDMVLEGGSIEYNGAGVMITTDVLTLRNPDLTEGDVKDILYDSFESLEDIIWLHNTNNLDEITNGHVDGIARFINATTVAVHYESGTENAWIYDEAAETIKEHGLEVVRIPTGGPFYIEGESEPICSNYVNWLNSDKFILVPSFGSPHEEELIEPLFAKLFPDKDVVFQPITTLWGAGGGGLHCITNNQPAL